VLLCTLAAAMLPPDDAEKQRQEGRAWNSLSRAGRSVALGAVSSACRVAASAFRAPGLPAAWHGTCARTVVEIAG